MKPPAFHSAANASKARGVRAVSSAWAKKTARNQNAKGAMMYLLMNFSGDSVKHVWTRAVMTDAKSAIMKK